MFIGYETAMKIKARISPFFIEYDYPIALGQHSQLKDNFDSRFALFTHIVTRYCSCGMWLSCTEKSSCNVIVFHRTFICFHRNCMRNACTYHINEAVASCKQCILKSAKCKLAKKDGHLNEEQDCCFVPRGSRHTNFF